jgi:gluconate 2-dehydrogenase gamma chain
MHDDYSRRIFLSRLVAGAGASVALSALPRLAEAHEHAAKQIASSSKKLHFFTPEEWHELAAVCEQIIPSEPDAPGAREAGAVYFIDYAVSNAEPDLQPIFRSGLNELAAEAHKFDAAKKFSDLSSDQQIAVLKAIEQSEFFQLARKYTIIGFLGDPKYDGNRDEVGWKYIGFENPGMFKPPFGYYDAQLLSEKKEGK